MTPGTECRIGLTKWGGAFACGMSGLFLCRDEIGSWLGMPAGWSMERPAKTLTIPYACVFHVPENRGYLARFADPEAQLGAAVYVDITTPPAWRGSKLDMVDLDFDVVRGWDGQVQVVDEDEFATNSKNLDYPPDVVAGARQSLVDVLEMIQRGEGPFGDDIADKFRLLDELSRHR